MDMAEGRMVMQTDDAKVFRHIRPAVAALQAKLATLGLFVGEINGLYGPSSRAALVAYQRQHGLEPTGLPTFETTQMLRGLAREQMPGPEHADPDAAGQAEPEMKMRHEMPAPGEMQHDMHAAGGGDPESTDPGTLAGDPSIPKMLIPMEMPDMKMENDHTHAVRAVTGFTAALGVGGDAGELDFEKSLALFGLDRSAVEAEFGERIDLGGSPVSLDRALMDHSLRRYGRDPGEPDSTGRSGSSRPEDRR